MTLVVMGGDQVKYRSHLDSSLRQIQGQQKWKGKRRGQMHTLGSQLGLGHQPAVQTPTGSLILSRGIAEGCEDNSQRI